jgi:succinate dehydrogenase / fumarate reductase cytochrome b subunit
MADVNRGDRPLSPHLSIYRPQWSSVLSIFHRITGAGMSVGLVMVVVWLFAAASGPDYFAAVNGFVMSWFGQLILLLSLLALSYHFCNGIRHLAWDMGKGLDLESSAMSAKAAVGGAVVLTVLVLLI